MTEEQRKRKNERDRERRARIKAGKNNPAVQVDAVSNPSNHDGDKAGASPAVQAGAPAKPERELTPFELLKRRRERYS